jgi:uncharacterized repeat protein (TIGR03803 family)
MQPHVTDKIGSTGTFTTLHSFDATDGDGAAAALVQATNENFYGTTLGGGANGNGTVFQITPSGTLTTLHSFDNTDGRNANALIQDTRGTCTGRPQEGPALSENTTAAPASAARSSACL